jgi:hypothetical protein
VSKDLKVEYSFAARAEVLDRDSKELQEYEEYFEREILPEMKEVERRKVKAREKAYQLHVSAHNPGPSGNLCISSLFLK